MKTYITKALLIILMGTVLYSCTDVIDVDVPTGKPRLVVEASIDWEKGTDGKNQTIKLSRMTPYFSNQEIDEVLGATVTIKDKETGDVFSFQDQNNGLYTTDVFIPVLGHSYVLTINHEGETYRAEETMMSVADIQKIDQSTDGGNSSEDIEVNIHFQDPQGIENYYFLKFQRVGDLLPTIEPMSDKFTDGNVMKESFEKEDDADTSEKEQLKPGDVVEYQMLGISQRYYDYMQIMVNQLGAEASIFAGVPVELKGNCININDKKEFTLGYFRVTETIKGSYTIQ